MPERKNYEPFLKGKKFKTETSGAFSSIWEIKDDPEVLVKQIKPAEKDSIENFEELRQDVEEDLRLLEKHVGQFLPEHQLVYGGKSKKEIKSIKPYILTEKITPVVQKNEEVKRTMAEQLDNFFDATSKMFLATYQNGVGKTPDLDHSNNFIFGTSEKNPTPKLYYVDYYPIARLIATEEVEQFISKIIRPYQEIYDFPKTKKFFELMDNLRGLLDKQHKRKY